MDAQVTRRRFLRAAGASAAYLALANTLGCQSPDHTNNKKKKVSPLRRRSGFSPYAPPPPPADGLWAFRSRPDLSPPVVEVVREAHHTAQGYVFVAPEEGEVGQGGSLIIDDRGRVVWFRPLKDAYGRAMNFEVQTYRGESVLTWMETPGKYESEYVIFDSSYREIARFGAANGYDGDHHEFFISPQDTALFTVYNAVPRDHTSVGGSKDGIAWQGIVQELDIETGEVLFEWHSIDHVGLDETYVTALQDGRTGLDYFHINSIDVDHDENLLISARETST